MKKIIRSTVTVFVVFLAVFGLNAAPVFAHAVMKPSTAGVASFTDFSLGVPSEKEASTTKVQLIVPTGLTNISPIVKPGWTIEVKQAPDPSGAKDDDGNPAMIVSEIDWTGGQIPAHQKDFFMFSAQVPAQPGELDWVVNQTYSDGSVVSWSKTAADQPKDNKGNPDFSKFGPYSKTMVVNDLNPSTAPVAVTSNPVQPSSSPSMAFSIIALALSAAALVLALRRRA